jgi:RHS repeat-associated protein
VTAGSNDVDYAYDPFGRRQWMSVNGAKTYYVYDGDHILAEYDNAGTMKREYVYGPWLDEVVSILRVSPKFRCFYYQDGLGSISEIMDSTGVLFEQYEYEPYGKTTVKNKTGTVLPNGSAIGNRFAFTGRRLDYETKLYDYRARVYSPEIGRFMQRDQYRYVDGMNLYTYVANNPIIYRDPFGLFVQGPFSDFYWSVLVPRLLKVHGIGLKELGNRDIDAHNNAADAMRHAEWQRRAAQEVDPCSAWLGALYWELRGTARLPPQPWSELIMDLHNNAVGREARHHDSVDPTKLWWFSPERHMGSAWNPYR